MTTKHSFRNQNGWYGATSSAIFLVLAGDCENVSGAIGTGFFAAPYGLFFTAAHVLDEEAPLSVVEILPEEQTFMQRSVIKAFKHARTDVALGFTEPATDKDSGACFSSQFLAVTSEIPTPGDRVFSFGYPYTIVAEGIRDVPTCVFPSPTWVDGTVLRHFPNGRDRVIQPGHSVEVSFFAQGNMSGSPVMDRHGRTFGVVSSSLGNGPSYVAPIGDLYENPIRSVRLRGRLDQVPLVRDLLLNGGNMPPPG